MNNKKMNKKGFTIVELVIVIAVIAVLAGAMIPTFTSIITKSNESAALQEVSAAYKVYLVDAYTDEDEDTPVDKIFVEHSNGTIITIEGGEAKVVSAAPNASEGFTELEIGTSAAGDKTLVAPAAGGSGT